MIQLLQEPLKWPNLNEGLIANANFAKLIRGMFETDDNILQLMFAVSRARRDHIFERLRHAESNVLPSLFTDFAKEINESKSETSGCSRFQPLLAKVLTWLDHQFDTTKEVRGFVESNNPNNLAFLPGAMLLYRGANDSESQAVKTEQ